MDLVESGTNAHRVSFSGQQGYLFDQSGRYFNGYQSGTTFNLKVFYDYSNRTFTFYHDDVLVANSYDVTGFSQGAGFINTVVFDKEDTSSLSVDVSGITT